MYHMCDHGQYLEIWLQLFSEKYRLLTFSKKNTRDITTAGKIRKPKLRTRFASINFRYFGFYQFLSPTLMLKDIDLIRQICIKEFDKFPDHAEFLPKESDPFWNRGLFALEGTLSLKISFF